MEVECLAGISREKVSPRSRHALVQAGMVQILSRCGGERGFAGTEWRFLLSGAPLRTLLVPDVAFISAQRLRSLPPGERDEPTIAPEVAVEIRSPGLDVRYLQEKIAAYLAHGAVLVLDVRPDVRSIVAHMSDATRVFSADERFAIDSLPWLVFDAREVFAQMDAFERL